MFGEFAPNGGRRSVHAHGRGNVAVLGEVGNQSLNPMPKAATRLQRGFQLENAGADLFDDCLQIVKRAVSRSVTSGDRTARPYPAEPCLRRITFG